MGDVEVYSAGDPVLGSHHKWVRRTVDSAAKTNNTLANDDTLLWAVQANEVWFFEGYLRIGAVNTTMDAKWGWSVPAGTTMSWGRIGPTGAGFTGYGSQPSGTDPAVNTTESGTLTSGSANGTTGVILAGIVIASTTPGNVNLQWAQNTTDAGELKVLAHSFLRLTRLG